MSCTKSQKIKGAILWWILLKKITKFSHHRVPKTLNLWGVLLKVITKPRVGRNKDLWWILLRSITKPCPALGSSNVGHSLDLGDPRARHGFVMDLSKIHHKSLFLPTLGFVMTFSKTHHKFKVLGTLWCENFVMDLSKIHHKILTLLFLRFRITHDKSQMQVFRNPVIRYGA